LITATLNRESFKVEPIEFLKPLGGIGNKRLEQDPLVSSPDTYTIAFEAKFLRQPDSLTASVAE